MAGASPLTNSDRTLPPIANLRNSKITGEASQGRPDEKLIGTPLGEIGFALPLTERVLPVAT